MYKERSETSSKFIKQLISSVFQTVRVEGECWVRFRVSKITCSLFNNFRSNFFNIQYAEEVDLRLIFSSNLCNFICIINRILKGAVDGLEMI